ncbi:MAG: GNAT family N-acetyltransferase [Candidatus Latescibacterota bacterium]|jgi:hypothetical protein
MSASYQIRPIQDRPLWDSFVDSALGGSPFSKQAWLDCSANALGGHPTYLGIFKNDKLVAGLAAIAHRRRGFTRLETPELTPHTGLLLAPIESKGPAKIEAETHRASELLIDYLRCHYDHVRLSHSPSLHDVRPFSWAGWQPRVRYTYQMNLSNLDALWERIERRTRTTIRKAEKLGYTLEETDDLDLFCSLYELIYTRQKQAPPVATAKIQSFVGSALGEKLARMYAISSPTGETAAIVAFVEDCDTSYAWVAGTDPAHNNTGATSLLYWQYFSLCEKARFDFVGANLPAISFFKRGLGGDLVPYYATEGFGNTWLKKAVHLKRFIAG